ncbi:MAG: transglutaminase-like cysteine peptidase [Rhodospirillaceae bacterium]|nr:transglutaminase-like cysteine peptidase [Rhodospirillaceae bacterium]
MTRKNNRKITTRRSGIFNHGQNTGFLLLPVLAIVIGASIVFSGFSPALAVMAPSFFNSTEEVNSDLTPFKKWTSALNKYSKEVAARKAGPCGGKELNSCSYGKWTSFLDGIKGKDVATKIREVNNYMNRAPYITDTQNWGTKDYWSSPGEFMAKFGDCEDFAIAKYMSLRYLGFKEDDMRVVAVKDMNLKVGHAVLVIFLGGKSYVMDNQIKNVVSTTKIRHYVPVFSINAKSWWKHMPAS